MFSETTDGRRSFRGERTIVFPQERKVVDTDSGGIDAV
jgi:hypothetical protein